MNKRIEMINDAISMLTLRSEYDREYLRGAEREIDILQLTPRDEVLDVLLSEIDDDIHDGYRTAIMEGVAYQIENL